MTAGDVAIHTSSRGSEATYLGMTLTIKGLEDKQNIERSERPENYTKYCGFGKIERGSDNKEAQLRY